MLLYQLVITFSLVPIVIYSLRQLILDKTTERDNCVHMPIMFLVIGIGGGVISCVTIIISFFVSFVNSAIVATVASIIVSVVCLLGYFSQRIQYDDEYIFITKLFRSRRYAYKDIQGVELRGYGGYCLILEEEKIHIDGFSVGKEDFIEFINQKYAEMHDNCSVPVLENKLFNGYVIEPEPHAVLICLPCIGLMIISLLATYELYAIKIPQNLAHASIVAEKTENDGKVFIFVDGNREYRILEEAISDKDALVSAVTHKQAIAVEYVVAAEREEKLVLSVWDLRVDNNRLATCETVFEAEKHDGMFTVAMLWTGTILYGLMVGGIFYVLTHAPKYSFLAKLLIKKEYRNF